MKLLIKILLYVFIALITDVNVVNASIPFTNIQEAATSFSYYTEIPKTVVGVVENDLVNCCQNGQDLVDYRDWGTSIEAVAAKGAKSAFDIAKEGGKHSGFYKNYVGRSADEINKAIKSMQSGKEGISVHLDKIANPTKYVPDWNTLRPGHQQSLIRGWQNTVTKHTEQIQILKGILGN